MPRSSNCVTGSRFNPDLTRVAMTHIPELSSALPLNRARISSLTLRRSHRARNDMAATHLQSQHFGWQRVLSSTDAERLAKDRQQTDESALEGNHHTPHYVFNRGSPATLAPAPPATSNNPRSSDTSRAQIAVEDEALRCIARTSMHRVESIATNAFVSGKWKQRKSPPSELVLENKSKLGYRVIARSMVPCTIEEISSVLSNTDADRFNASMLELLGSEFGYAVTVRSIPTPAPESSALSLKVLSFANRKSTLKSGAKFLDYTERDNERRSERRVAQLIKRARRRNATNGEVPQILAGDLLCGYALHEDQATKHTLMLLYGSYSAEGRADRAHRHAATQHLRKMMQVSTKWVDIVMRKRLGKQVILDPLEVFVPVLSCVSCNKDFHSIFRKSHFCYFCGHQTCGKCSSVQDAEASIGKIEKLRICWDCSKRVNRHAFEKSGEIGSIEVCRQARTRQTSRALQDSDARPKYRLYTIV